MKNIYNFINDFKELLAHVDYIALEKDIFLVTETVEFIFKNVRFLFQKCNLEEQKKIVEILKEIKNKQEDETITNLLGNIISRFDIESRLQYIKIIDRRYKNND